MKSILALSAILTVALPANAADPMKESAESFEHQWRWMARVVLEEEILKEDDPSAISPLAILDVDARGRPGSRLLQAAGKTPTRPLPLVSYHLLHGLLALVAPEPPQDRRGLVTWHGEGKLVGLLTPVGEEVLLRAPFLLPIEWEEALHERSTPLELSEGHPMLLREVVSFVLPPGMRRLELPEPVEGHGGPLEWSLTWQRKEPGQRHLEARLEAVLRQTRLGQDEIPAFQKELRRLYGALGRGARYRP